MALPSGSAWILTGKKPSLSSTKRANRSRGKGYRENPGAMKVLRRAAGRGVGSQGAGVRWDAGEQRPGVRVAGGSQGAVRAAAARVWGCGTHTTELAQQLGNLARELTTRVMRASPVEGVSPVHVLHGPLAHDIILDDVADTVPAGAKHCVCVCTREHACVRVRVCVRVVCVWPVRLCVFGLCMSMCCSGMHDPTDRARRLLGARRRVRLGRRAAHQAMRVSVVSLL